MKYPFADTKRFPLATYPYKSRLHNQLSTNKGYSFVAFQPGYPLQAQELNEIQDIAYLQSTLNQVMTNSWCTSKIMQSVSPTATTPVYGPGWDGCTPLKPDSSGSDYVKITTASPYTVTVNPGWYLLRSSLNSSLNILGGLGVWVYYPDTVTVGSFTPGTPSVNIIYAIGTLYNVGCSNTEEPETEVLDLGLRDFSSFNTINGPCGAFRYAVKIRNFSTSNSVLGGQQAFPLMTVETTATGISFKYGNNYQVFSA